MRRTLVAGLAGLLAAGLVAVPLTASAAPTAAPAAPAAGAAVTVPTPPALSWGRCDDKGLRQSGAECALMTVPLDYAAPASGTIQVAVARVLHTKEPFKGAVFTNPGGPGGAGRGLATYAQYVPKKAGLNYDWYGVDPRGVGASVPALTCDPTYTKPRRQPYKPTTAAIRDYWVTRSANYATACGNSAAKALLPHLKTVDSVNDFESLRLAIGQAQITWFGFSYGTQLGQTYASVYPTSIKAMILDGVADVQRPPYQGYNFDQDFAFEKTFDAFFKWTAKYRDVYQLGKTQKQVRKTYLRTRKQLAKKPMGKVGASEFDDATLNAGYYNFTWIDIAEAWSKLVNKGNARGIKSLYGYEAAPDADNGYAMYLATACTDAPWPTDLNQWLSDSATVDQQAPILTWANTWFNMPCRTWPAAPAAGTPINGSFTGPVLLSAETKDAATPFSGALATRAIFPGSVLIEGKGGTSHAIALNGVSCIDSAIATLLKKGTLPARKAGNRADVRCQGLKPPVPATEDSDGSARFSATLPRTPLFH